MIKKISLLFLFAFIFLSIQAQDKLLEARQSSFYTYIYKITNEQAKQFLTQDNAFDDEKWLKVLVDSFQTEKTNQKKLPNGHYIFAKVVGDKLIIALVSIIPYKVKILNNFIDFQVIVHDSLGNLITEVDVKINQTRISFNKKSGTYLHKKSNKSGVLSVSYQNIIGYYQISKSYKNSRFRRISNKILSNFPVKYILQPIFWTYYKSKKLIRIIQGRYYDNYSWYRTKERNENNYKSSYLVLSKPKYMPKDTIRLKAFVVNKKGIPYTKKVHLWLDGKKLAVLTPYKAGHFEYQLVLNDSLKLALDRDYSMTIRTLSKEKRKKKNDNNYYDDDRNDNSFNLTSTKFQYEDYELKENTYTLELNNPKKTEVNNDFYQNEPIKILVEGKDNNNLNVLDGRVRLKIFTNSVRAMSEKNVFVPNTIWIHEQKLDVLGKTQIIVPDSVLPKAYFSAEIYAQFLNSSQEIVSKNIGFSYFPKERKNDLAEFEIKNDSIFIHSKIIKSNEKVMLNIMANDEKNIVDNTLISKIITLPYTEKVNLAATTYQIKQDSTNFINYNIDKNSSQMLILAEKTKDSVLINVENPKNILFWYVIYKQNKVVERGYQSKLNFKKNDKTSNIYFLDLQYMWAGELVREYYYLDFNTQKLQVLVKQPTKISPGQKVKIDIEVKDANDKAVANADVLAYSLTNKFKNISVPEISYFRTVKNRINLNRFEKNKLQKTNAVQSLNWSNWHKKMGLDSLEFYNFLYNNNGVYVHKMPVKSGITQISPYVIENGELQKIYHLEVNDMPVYFEKAAQDFFSFPVPSPIRKIVIRTYNKRITLKDTIHCDGQKLIIGINVSKNNPKVMIEKMPTKWQTTEKNRIKNSLMYYTHSSNFSTVYMEQSKNIFMFQNDKAYYAMPEIDKNNYNSNIIANFNYPRYNQYKPIFPVLSQNFNVYLRNNNQIFPRFNINFEPFNSYEFDIQNRVGIVKMKFFNTDKDLFKHRLTPQRTKVRFEEEAFSKQEMENLFLPPTKITPLFPFTTNTEDNKKPNETTIKMVLSGDNEWRKEAEYLILIKENDTTFVQNYPLYTTIFYNIPINAVYEFYFIQKNGAYCMVKTEKLRPNGTNLLHINIEKILPIDKKGSDAFDLLWNKFYNPIKSNITKPTFDKKASAIDVKKDSRPNVIIRGKIMDKNGEGLPGTSILIQGTTTGTVSDIEGFYEIYAPKNSILVFQFLGMVTKEIINNGNNILSNVILEEDTKRMQEVVVTGYSSVEKSEKTGIISTPDINFDRTFQGISGGVRIRGIGSFSGNELPLYVVDGVIISSEEFANISPDNMQNVNILKDAAATSAYGAKGANGVIIVQTKNNKSKSGIINPKTLLIDEATAMPQPEKTLRNNFSDVGFWKPKLTTNQEGKVSFETIFPDDITTWKTIYVAHDDKKRGGITQSSIKAYKSLMASLSIPRFLVEGDTVNILGKVSNYSGDTLQVSTEFSMLKKDKSNTILKQFSHKISSSALDSLNLIAEGKDTLEIAYQMKLKNELVDGEVRKIPMYAYGTKETKGKFLVLERDTTFEMNFDKDTKNIFISAQAFPLDMILEETQKLRNYEHLCNEQMASKLLALLSEKEIFKALKKDFLYDKDIKKLIKLLENKQKENGLWGWWERTEGINWVSNQVIKALIKARKLGFETNFKEEILIGYLTNELNKTNNNFQLDDFLTKIYLLKELDTNIDGKQYIDIWKKTNSLSTINVTQQLRIWEILLNSQQKIPVDSILKLEKQTILGEIYWGDYAYDLHHNSFQSTIYVYRILKKIGGYEDKLKKMRLFFLKNKDNFRNTYETSSVIETILVDILEEHQKTISQKSSLTFSGDFSKNVEKFPFSVEINNTKTIKVTKKGNAYVYLSFYEQYWNEKPKKVENDFIIQTNFENNPKTLTAGKPIKLNIEVEVKKLAEFVMVEIPIPAGCTYENKAQNNYGNYEIHREYYRNKVCIFMQKLPAGKYQYNIDLQPRYSGKYAINPAKVELMYFPTFFGRNESKRIEIK